MTLKPYYEHAGVTIYHADCRDIIPHVSADVLVTDPPYGMSYCSGWSARPIAGDDDTSVRDEVMALWGSRPAVVFGRWNCPRPINVRTLLVWDKGEWPGMGDLSLPWGPSHEEIYVLGDGFKGKRSGTVLRVRRLGGAAMDHPNEKPPELLQMILERCPNGTVIDPFCGSGSTLVAAKMEGRPAIGVEIDERYAELSAKRLSQEVFNFH